jgi:phage gp16-like protein
MKMTPKRRARLAAIHMGKKHLGLDDDTYRDLLESACGVRSAADATDDGLVAVLRRMESQGFVQKTKKDVGRRPNTPQRDKVELVKKIEALLADAGRHWNYAHGCAKKMFGKDAVEFCTGDELWRIVAALEKDKARRAKREQLD